MTQTSLLPLNNKHIMVTRPAHQAEQLIALLEQAGAAIYCQPLIEIVAIDNPTRAIEQVKALPKTDIAIFISQNAVTHGMNLIEKYGGLPANVLTATVGQGSATLLEQRTGRNIDIMPLNEFNSEGLLAHPVLQTVKDKNITIYRGIGGRNLLADTLHERGANVEYAEVYQRNPATIDTAKLAQIWQTKPIDTICITSGEGLTNLAAKLSENATPEQLRADILNCQLIIVNKRLESLAQKHGFKKDPIITDTVSDKAIVDAIIKTTR